MTIRSQEWYNILLEMVSGEFQTVTIDGIGNAIGKDEAVVVLRDLSGLFKCSNKTVYRFIDFLIEQKYISKRVIGFGNKKKTVLKFLKKEMSTKSNADEQRDFANFWENPKWIYKKPCLQRVTLMNKGISDFWHSKDADLLKNEMSTKGNADEQRDLLFFDNIPKNILTDKAVEMIKLHPEIVNKGITRWINGKLKKENKVVSPSFIKCRDIYYEFFKKRNNNVPPKWDGAKGEKLNNILKHLETVAISKESSLRDDIDKLSIEVENSFNYVFSNWDKLDSFWQNKIDISIIDSKFDTILTQINNNAKPKSTISTVQQQRIDADLKYLQQFNSPEHSEPEENKGFVI